jgi:hypothetical protein
MKNLILASVCFSAMLLNIQNVQAQTCVTPPSCYFLGYTKTVSQCSGKAMLKCPLDTSMVFCDNSSSSSGGTTTSCPSGYFPYSQIINSCDETQGNAKLVQHNTYSGCYMCKKCMSGYYFNNKCSIGSSKDSIGCERCSAEYGCSVTSSDYKTGPVDGWCR